MKPEHDNDNSTVEPTIDSLLKVHASHGGGTDRELCESIFAATTHQSGDSKITPFPQPAPAQQPHDYTWLKVAAIVMGVCGLGLGALSTLRPSNAPVITGVDQNHPIEVSPITVIFDDNRPQETVNAVAKAAPVQSYLDNQISYETPDSSTPPPTSGVLLDTVSNRLTGIESPTPSADLTIHAAPAEPKAVTSTEIASKSHGKLAEGIAAVSGRNSTALVAVVNGSLLTTDDLKGYKAEMEAFDALGYASGLQSASPIDSLIAEHLLLSEFKRRGGKVQPQYLDQSIEKLIEDHFSGSHSSFRKTLTKTGFSDTQLRNYVERQIAIRALVAGDNELLQRLLKGAEILRL